DVYDLMVMLEDLGVGEDVFLRARHEVLNGDVFELLDGVGGDESAFGYLDPPYTPDCTLIHKHYGDRSWTMADHERLVDKLLGVRMKVALSGYNSPVYDRLV